MGTPGADVEAVLDRARAWASARADVVAVALVGSRARGTARPDSDVDLVVLTTDPDRYVHATDWVAGLAGADVPVVRTADWGAVTERRLALPGTDVTLEVGVGRPSWADVDPVDPGTARVVSDGMRVVHDPAGLLARLAAAVRP